MDVELVLAVDVSWSMDEQEQRLQREGYVSALRDPEVQRAIRNGPLGRVAITYVEWAGQTMQATVIPWTLVDSKEAADLFAYRLGVEEPARERRTSISAALDYALLAFEANGFAGQRRVVDISGDGPNNQGGPVTQARDRAVSRGVVVNGLPLMTNSSGFADAWGGIPDLDRYYTDCVVGGPGSFVLPVRSWDQFPDAVRRKLVLELASAPPPKGSEDRDRPMLAAASAEGADCLIGERLWRQRQERGGWN